MPDSDAKDHCDVTFRDAILRKDVTMVKAMLAKGISISKRDNKGLTPLMFAAKAGSPALVELLLAAGADPTPKDTAEMIANWYGEWRMGAYTNESQRIVQMLRQAAARRGAG